jgi:hypothetical protein
MYRYLIAQDFLNFIVIYVKITWRLAENVGHVVDLLDIGITNNLTIVYYLLTRTLFVVVILSNNVVVHLPSLLKLKLNF